MHIEKAAAGSSAAERAEDYVKIQISGYCGDLALRSSICGMKCDRPIPARSLDRFLEAFKRCNEPAWELLDDLLHNGPMSKLSREEPDDLGETAGKFWVRVRGIGLVTSPPFS